MSSGFVGMSGENKFPALDEEYSVEEISLLQNMRCADDGELGEGQRLKERHERLLGRRVKPGGGLVEKEHARFGQKFNRDTHAFALATGKVRDALVGMCRQPQPRDHAQNQRVYLMPRQAEP